MSCLNELQKLIQDKYDVDPSKLDVNGSMREAGLDSLTMVEFLFAVEDHFGITLPEIPPSMDRLADLATVVDGVLAARNTGAAAA
jgi:acyl carrier protein